MGIKFGVLGPVRLRRGPRLVPAAGRMQAVLLGVLLARANTAVPVDVLIDAMWGAPDPRGAQRLQLHVHRLRRALDDPDRLTFHSDGYLLRVGADELDATRFEVLVRDGRPESLREALELWQGDPYPGLDVPLLTDEAARLTELRVATEEERLAAEIAEGRAASVVGDLAELVRAHPLRERAHLLHVTALYEVGRRADALAAYRAARDVLVLELGIEPGFELRELEARVLADEPAAAPGGPAQLPNDVPAFVGRADATARLDESWASRVGYTFAHLADLYWDWDKPADAREWYDKGVTASLAAGDRWLAAKLLTRLAALDREPGVRLRQAHALFDEVGDAESAAEVRELLAAG